MKFRHLVIAIILVCSLFTTLMAKEKSLFNPHRHTKQEKKQLEIFDDLDYRVFSHQQWEDLHLSHSQDVIVHWPDGRTTKGIDNHIADLKYLFTYAPDTRIEVHPIRIAKAEWTAVQGIMEGTFSQPMVLADGTVIPATGKSFKISMVTLGHWKNGSMDEEYLYWDNLTFMKQIGLMQ